MKINKTIIITGTHHTPAIELIRELRSDPKVNWQIYYLGHQYSAETHIVHTIIPKLKVPFYNLDCGKFNRRDLLETVSSIPTTIKAIFVAKKLIRQIRPDIVVSFGGYVSVPVIVAAFFQKIPSLTHEQTTTNSLSTKINGLFVNKIALSFDNKDQINQLPKNKVTITGNLIRQAIFNTDSKKFKDLSLKIGHFPIIYITGGNQGSNFLNNLIKETLPILSKKYFLIHQTGNNFSASKLTNYYSAAYIEIEDIGWILNHADIIISRAGANTCQELDTLNKKAIIIPLPFTQQNEQLLNAQWLQSRHLKTIKVIPQSQANPSTLISDINFLNQLPSPKPNQKQFISPSKLLKLIHDLV